MSMTALAVFALALLVDSASPGPTVAALVARVLAHGVRDVLPFLLAVWLGEAVWLTLTVAGLAAVAQALGTLFLVVKYAGVAYLLVLAWNLWHAPVAAAGTPLRGRTRPSRMFAAGLLVSIGNPKNLVFYLALVPALVDLGRVGPAGWAELVATMVATLALVDLSWCVAAAQARRLLASRRAMRAANRVSASMMAGAAVAVATR